VKYAADNGGAF